MCLTKDYASDKGIKALNADIDSLKTSRKWSTGQKRRDYNEQIDQKKKLIEERKLIIDQQKNAQQTRPGNEPVSVLNGAF